MEKSQKPEWTSNLVARGFYGRVGATVSLGEHGNRTVPFSTTEPRVLLRTDFAWLTATFEHDLRFLATFVENARRDWPPIWEMESGRWSPVAEIPYATWLLGGSRVPGLAGS